MDRWLGAESPADLKQALLRSDHSLTLALDPRANSGGWIGQTIASLGLADGILVALVYRGHERIIPTGRTVLQAGDRVIMIGEQNDINFLRNNLGLESGSDL